MAESSKQSVKWYWEVVTQLIKNQAALKAQLDKQDHCTIKILLVKYFLGEAYKLRGFLI